MNYFEFYQLPVSFLVDAEMVKEKFISISKKFHPDFFANASLEDQDHALAMATMNTKAFQTLSDFDKRMKYILELKNEIHEGERHELPADFLMEMMEFNEAIAELKMESNSGMQNTLRAKAEDKMKELFSEASQAIEHFDAKHEIESDLATIKDYYFKKKYLLRIMESLDTFGAL